MGAKLPQRLGLSDMQTRWATILDPISESSIVHGSQLNDIKLTTGNNVVNHKLSRKLQGWLIVGIDGISSIYDTQATNQTPQLTLNLVSSADVNIALWVY